MFLKKYAALIFFICITVFFFYKTFLHGLLPFPGDLLISEYQPWKSYSYLGYNPGSYPNKKQYFDTIRQIYPWRTFVNEQLRSGSLPLWNPYNFSGQPLLANIQSQVFYPLTILYFIFTQPIAWTILIILQPLLALLGMYWFLRTLERSKTSSTFGAIAYGLCLYMTVFLEYNTIGHVILWLPFLLAALESMNKNSSAKYRLYFALFLLNSAFAGHLQLFATIVIFTALYSLCVIRKKRVVVECFFLIIAAAGIVSIQYIPTLELMYHAARSNHEYIDVVERLLVQPKQLLTFIQPDLFGNPATGNYLSQDSYPGKALFFGVAPFFFMILCLLTLKKNRHIQFFSYSWLFILLFVTNNPLTRVLYQVSIPFLSQSAPGNYIFLLTFCGSVLAAFGFDYWSQQKSDSRRALLVMAGIVCLMWILKIFFHTPMNMKMVVLATFSSGIIVSMSILKRFLGYKIIIGSMLVMITIGELWYSFQKFNPFVPSQLVFPDTTITSELKNISVFNRLYGYGAGEIESNFATQLKLYDPNGYDPLYPKMYGAFIESSIDGTISSSFNRTNRSDAKITPGYGNTSFRENAHRENVINLLGVKYIINKEENGTSEQTFDPLFYPVVYKKDGFMLHENKLALPRVFLTSAVTRQINSENILLEKNSPTNTQSIPIVINEEFSETLENSSGSAELVLYTPNQVKVQTKSDTKQLLFLSDTYMPGWLAYIDSKETKIYRAQYAFRGVVVPEGTHTITFVYKPKSFLYGILITIFSSIGLLLYVVWFKIRYTNKN